MSTQIRYFQSAYFCSEVILYSCLKIVKTAMKHNWEYHLMFIFWCLWTFMTLYKDFVLRDTKWVVTSSVHSNIKLNLVLTGAHSNHKNTTPQTCVLFMFMSQYFLRFSLGVDIIADMIALSVTTKTVMYSERRK